MLNTGNNLRMKKCAYIALKIVSLTKERPGPYTLIRTQWWLSPSLFVTSVKHSVLNNTCVCFFFCSWGGAPNDRLNIICRMCRYRFVLGTAPVMSRSPQIWMAWWSKTDKWGREMYQGKYRIKNEIQRWRSCSGVPRDCVNINRLLAT